MLKRIVTPAALILMVACGHEIDMGPVPKGYTQEAWERMKVSRPEFARTLAWINQDPTRSQIRGIYTEHWHGQVEIADTLLVQAADFELVKGIQDGFKRSIVDITTAQGNDKRAQGDGDAARYDETVRKIKAL